ncbi:AAA family ATPase [Leifsonia sp. TF02-11]|uniref:ATP-binding protein n=1 Tax=Leifsonia sp. TF02-11 TaxID=2815212 RepID=UPI001AA16B5E|nr:AAA family ATPase [Leifsonia sp. TF02-11]MBO1739704.1 AAA family ATPase [Leifsonia sp. TF02-11]
MTQTKALRVTNLKAENYKRLVAVDISPTGNVVTIAGRNAQGKSSVLDALWAALAGGDASRATQQPIREGQDSAVVRLDLGDIVVTRRWTKDDAGTLTVESADGARYSSPQKLLDEMLGRRAFDPLAFVRQTPKEQVATLVSTVDLPFDPVDLERQRKGVYDQRTEVGRDVARLEAQLASFPDHDPDLPEEEQPASALLAEADAAREQNAKIDQLARDLEQRANAVQAAERAVAEAQDRLAAAKDSYVLVQTAWRDRPEQIDVAAIVERLDGLEASNRRIRAQRERAALAAQLAEVKGRQAQHTIKLQAIEKQKADALAAVEFPVPGLSFDDAGVTLHGIPLSQASSAEQLRVSVALAMAANPKLRVLRIMDGSLLDSESMDIIAELAHENDYQVWVEVVDESGKVGVVIEDGQVAR